MDPRFTIVSSLATQQHSVVSLTQLERAGVRAPMRSRWVAAGLLVRLGPRSFGAAGSAPTWMRSLAAAYLDLDGRAPIAGRSAARLHGLDGFTGEEVELLTARDDRRRRSSGVVRSTARPIERGDVVRIEGLRVLRAERLIVDGPLFGFTRNELENAIDSAVRKRLVAEQRLRTRVIALHSRGLNGGRLLLDALVDTGGESRLERWFLRIVREAGIDRPMLQKVFRVDGRTVARVDAFFPAGLVVEVAGHGTHATRRQRQVDAQRQTELTLRGYRVLTFTYEDVRDRPEWVIARLGDALRLVA